MGLLTLVLGGARSGKSAFAERLAAGYGDRVLYLATARQGDAETDARIRAHQARRPANWHTVEAPCDPALGLADGQRWDAILLDSVTLWMSNLCLESLEGNGEWDQRSWERVEQNARDSVARLLERQMERTEEFIVVSDEVGLGIVPATTLGRGFRDLLGIANQELAANAGRVALIVAGLPLWLKGGA